jgi:hypothetical protein
MYDMRASANPILLLLFPITVCAQVGSLEQPPFEGRMLFSAVWHNDGSLELLGLKESVGQVPDQNVTRAALAHLNFAPRSERAERVNSLTMAE